MSRLINSYYTNRCQQVTRLTFTHMLYSHVHMVNIVFQKISEHSVVPSRHWGRFSFGPHCQMSDIIQQHSGNMPMSCTLGFTDEELRRWWRIQNRRPPTSCSLKTLPNRPEQWNAFLILLASIPHIVSHRPVLVNVEKQQGSDLSFSTGLLSNLPSYQHLGRSGEPSVMSGLSGACAH